MASSLSSMNPVSLAVNPDSNSKVANSCSSQNYWNSHQNPGLLHRSLKERPVVAVSASEHKITLQNGSQIIDACGGAAVAIIGHGNQEVIDAMTAQARSVSYVHTMAYTTMAGEGLANLLVGKKPGGLSKAFFVGSGSEAMDGAMKLARQFYFEEGQTHRTHFISRRQSYHGNTFGSMSLSSNVARLIPYQAILLPNVSHVSPCYPYQYLLEGESIAAYVQRLASELEAEFQKIGPSNVIAFVAEPMVGATSACNNAVPGYFAAMKAICQRHGALLIMDEVMCGMGRTGTQFAWEHEGVAPDIMTIGKGLGGGYAPIAGILIAEHIIKAIGRGSGGFNHGQTYQAHPVSCAAALAVQTIVRRENLVQRCKESGLILQAALGRALGHEQYVGDIRGRGLFWGIEFVKDRKTKESFDPRLKFGSRVQQRALDLGVAVYPGSGTIDGIVGDHVILAPPFTITIEEIEIIVDVLVAAYQDIVRELL